MQEQRCAGSSVGEVFLPVVHYAALLLFMDCFFPNVFQTTRIGLIQRQNRKIAWINYSLL